ncbi:MAG: hypothetical protein M3413_02340 [Bacteroidota bacterium]|nr:hypothetical protein [Bacteroidota bacterium]
MKKVFLLLRDNKQLGPFTIDELLQHKLTTDDLIWVEGYSLAWSHPTELDLLKLSVAETTFNSDRKPTLPPDYKTLENKKNHNENSDVLKNKKKRKWADEDIEGRAEEIRRRTLEYVSKHHNQATSPLITDDHIRSYVKNPDIDFVVHKRSKGLSPNFIGAALVALMLLAGWYGKEKLFIAQNGSDIVTTQAATPMVIPISSAVTMQSSQNESAAFIDEEINDSLMVEEPLETYNIVTPAPKPKEQPAVASTVDFKDQSIESKVKIEKQPVKEIEIPVKETVTVQTKPDSIKAKPDSSTTKTKSKPKEELEEAEDKKKTLGQAIKSIFKKKNKNTDKEEEDENDN